MNAKGRPTPWSNRGGGRGVLDGHLIGSWPEPPNHWVSGATRQGKMGRELSAVEGRTSVGR